MSHILQNLGAISVIFGRNGCIDVIRSAAVICGEFVEFVSDPKNLFLSIMKAEFGHLSVNITSVMFQNALKILSHGLKGEISFKRSKKMTISTSGAFQNYWTKFTIAISLALIVSRGSIIPF